MSTEGSWSMRPLFFVCQCSHVGNRGKKVCGRSISIQLCRNVTVGRKPENAVNWERSQMERQRNASSLALLFCVGWGEQVDSQWGERSASPSSDQSDTEGAWKIHNAMMLLIGWKITFGAKCQACCADDALDGVKSACVRSRRAYEESLYCMNTAWTWGSCL